MGEGEEGKEEKNVIGTIVTDIKQIARTIGYSFWVRRRTQNPNQIAGLYFAGKVAQS